MLVDDEPSVGAPVLPLPLADSLFASVFEYLPAATLILAEDLRICSVNRKARSLLLPGHSPWQNHKIGKDIDGKIPTPPDSLTGLSLFDPCLPFCLQNASGGLRHFLVALTPGEQSIWNYTHHTPSSAGRRHDKAYGREQELETSLHQAIASELRAWDQCDVQFDLFATRSDVQDTTCIALTVINWTCDQREETSNDLDSAATNANGLNVERHRQLLSSAPEPSMINPMRSDSAPSAEIAVTPNPDFIDGKAFANISHELRTPIAVSRT